MNNENLNNRTKSTLEILKEIYSCILKKNEIENKIEKKIKNIFSWEVLENIKHLKKDNSYIICFLTKEAEEIYVIFDNKEKNKKHEKVIKDSLEIQKNLSHPIVFFKKLKKLNFLKTLENMQTFIKDKDC